MHKELGLRVAVVQRLDRPLVDRDIDLGLVYSLRLTLLLSERRLLGDQLLPQGHARLWLDHLLLDASGVAHKHVDSSQLGLVLAKRRLQADASLRDGGLLDLALLVG